MSKENIKQKCPALKTGTCHVLFSSGDAAILRPGVTNVSDAVVGVLENTPKMAARDIAGRAEVSCEDTIDVLLYLERISVVYQLNGYWMLASASEHSTRKLPGKMRRGRIKHTGKEPV